MRLGVSLYTIGVMCFLRIELLLVVTVYVYPCDVPYLVILLSYVTVGITWSRTLV